MKQNEYTQKNIDAIENYFKSGSTPDLKPLVGLEIEHQLLDIKNKDAVTYFGKEGRPGLKNIFERLAEHYPQKIYIEGNLLGLKAEDANITPETSCQLEISIAPYESLNEIRKAYERFRKAIDPILDEYGYALVNMAYHPYKSAEELEIIPKKRYFIMNDHFHRIGYKGHHMQRGSASTQVSINYENEKDAINKIQMINALTPILSAICDNAPYYLGQENHERIQRLYMYRDVDPSRCEIIPGSFERNFDFRTYAQKLYNISPIFIEDESGEVIETGFEKAIDLYKNKEMSLSEIEHLNSMTWPDVRLKKFIEIRPTDSLPIDLSLGYAALIKGIFYSKEAMKILNGILKDKQDNWKIDEKDVEQAILDIRKDHLGAELYGKSLNEWILFLFELARENLTEEEKTYLNKLENFAFDKPWLEKA